MKVLLLSQHFYPDLVSTGLHMTELACKMKKLQGNLDITVFCSDSAREDFSKRIKKKEIYKGVNIIRVSNLGRLHGSFFSRIIFALSFFSKTLIYCLLNISKYDKILLTTNPPFLGIVPLIINLISRTPYVFIAYDIFPQIAVKLEVIKENSLVNKLWSFINVFIYNNSEKVVVIGEDMRDVILKEMNIKDSNKLELIHNWSDKTSLIKIPKQKNIFLKKYNIHDKKILLYSGTFGKTHNIENILEASLDLKNRKEYLFIFVGGGSKKRIIKEFILINQSKNILLFPYQPFEHLSHSLSTADLSFVCLDSKFTGFSVPSKTYGLMALGIPIIGLLDDKSEIGNTILKYNCGKLWNKSSSKKLSDIIIETLENKKLLKEMGLNGYKAFKNNFDLSIAATKYLKLLNR